MRSSFHYPITALSTEPTLSGPASVPHYLAGQRAKAANPYGSSPHLLLPVLRLLLTASFSLLICFSTLAQNYSAGIGSGTGGICNVMVGPSAGRITTGGFNSFLGYRAGYANTTGGLNSFVGGYAGYSNTTGSFNSFLGQQAGNSNTEGDNNSFVGMQAGYSNTEGDNNSFVGYQSGYFNKTGRSNSFLGYQSGYSNNTGSDNSFVGMQSGYSNTKGGLNSFVGSNAGYRNTTGGQNSFLGYAAGYKNTKGGNNLFLGSYAGNSNTEGDNNSFVGTQAGYNTTGNSNSFLGHAAGYYHTTGSNNLFLGSNTSASMGNLSNAGAIGWRAYVSSANSLVLGSINGVNGATASTNVGIGTSAPAYLLHVNGNAAKPGGGSWTVASDRRLKKNIATFSEGLDVLQKVKPVWFEYNGEAGMPTDKKYVGIIAQEMQQIAPYTVGEFTYRDTTGKQEKYLDYDANALTYILVNSVKEQQGQLKEQQEQIKALGQVVAQKDAQITELQEENAALMQRLQLLEVAVNKLSGEPVKATENAAQLYQNEPNPTEGTTLIGYFLPQEATSAQLKVYSLTGVEVKSIDLKERGKGQVSLSVGQWAAGQYIYHLLVDGRSIASKKLLLHR
jgi:hypothetical protein